MSWWHWVLVHVLEESGISNSASRAYNFWSGFAGSNVLVLVTIAVYYYHHTCHASVWDLRWGHPVEGTAYRACHKHHPARPQGQQKRHVGADAIAQAWRSHHT